MSGLANDTNGAKDEGNACLACGACCASFRVDFSVQECEDEGGSVPAGLAVEVTHSTCRMRGTDHSPPRCAALTGRIGVQAACGIYEWRPSPCREFEAGSDACQQARARHGLPALDSATGSATWQTSPKDSSARE